MTTTPISIPENEINGHPPKGGSPNNPITARQLWTLTVKLPFKKAEVEHLSSEAAYDLIGANVTPF